jgi:hypothetical protein
MPGCCLAFSVLRLGVADFVRQVNKGYMQVKWLLGR